MVFRRWGVFLVLIFGIAGEAAFAANRDVCPTCSFRTLADALLAARDGDTLRVAGGTYDESLTFIDARSVRIEGGYSPDLRTRNTESFPTTMRGVVVSWYSSGDVSIDGLTITGSGTQGIFAWSENSSLAVTNCKIHHNASIGIYVLTIKSLLLQGNRLWENGGYGGIYVLDDHHSQAAIMGNVITDHSCAACVGLTVSNITSGDLLAHNTIQRNTVGMSLRTLSAGAAPRIEWNVVHDNTNNGIEMWGGNPMVAHNVVYRNGLRGFVFIFPSGGTFLHNVFALNGREGLSLQGRTSGPQAAIRNNVFFKNEHGLSVAGLGGWGGTNMQPATQYNTFYRNSMDELIDGSDAPWGFESEEPGSYGELNAPVWMNANIVHDPKFVDAENGDFRLKPESFLIDEGDPADDFSQEPAPSGRRVDVGVEGNSPSAPSSQDTLTISEVGVSWAGEALNIQFVPGSVSDALWLTLEYWNGQSFQSIPDGELSSVAPTLERGDRGLRVGTGVPVVMTWGKAKSSLPVGPAASQLRIAVAHGTTRTTSLVSIPGPCRTVATPATTEVNGYGGVIAFAVESACEWNASADVDWILLGATHGAGSLPSWFSVAPNDGATPRTARLSFNGQIIQITQGVRTCRSCSFITGGDERDDTSSTPPPTPQATPTPAVAPTVGLVSPPSPPVQEPVDSVGGGNQNPPQVAPTVSPSPRVPLQPTPKKLTKQQENAIKNGAEKKKKRARALALERARKAAAAARRAGARVRRP